MCSWEARKLHVPGLVGSRCLDIEVRDDEGACGVLVIQGVSLLQKVEQQC
jgi:hypothetical protein